MKRYLLLIFCTAALCTSCARSSGEVWEDSKTCGRYFGKGICSLFGKHVDSRDATIYYEEWTDYDAIADEYGELTMNPLAQESPGDPSSPLPGIEGFWTPEGELRRLFNNIHFNTDKYAITGTENVETLRKIANHLIKHPSTYVFVEGHADERGAAAYNLALGSRRSNSVRSFLIENGVNADQLHTISFGKERPLVAGHGPDSWRKNRRAQFKLYER